MYPLLYGQEVSF